MSFWLRCHCRAKPWDRARHAHRDTLDRCLPTQTLSTRTRTSWSPVSLLPCGKSFVFGVWAPETIPGTFAFHDAKHRFGGPINASRFGLFDRKRLMNRTSDTPSRIRQHRRPGADAINKAARSHDFSLVKEKNRTRSGMPSTDGSFFAFFRKPIGPQKWRDDFFHLS